MSFFKAKTVLEQLEKDLEEAKASLLEAEYKAGYYAKMVSLYRETIKRLEGYTADGIK